ncbi:MAG TPA: CoA transferase [Acidimicrobiales bacterium]|nr:CoA transferase [Acidimicrobiales bacterium]
MTAPLESRRVVELTDLRGAFCGRILADLGADVIRVELPGDRAGPAGEADADATAAAYRHANKRVLPLDDEAGLERLLARADVLVDNLPPRRRVELGLEPGPIQDRHPHLVHVVMADFGLDGPRSDWRLEPLTAQAAGGTLHASGFPDMAPCWFPGFLGHDCASVYGAIGAVSALVDRRRHGRGQTVEVSVQEATLAGTNPWSVAVHDYLKINAFLPAEGKRNADGFYYVLPAADGWVRFVIGNEKQWRGAVALAGDPDTLTSPEWLDPLFRRMNGDVVRLVMSDSLRDRTRAQLFEQAQQVGATMGVIHMPGEYVRHEQPRSRDVFGVGELPGLEGAPVVRPPLRFSATPGRAAAAPATPAPADPWPDRAPEPEPPAGSSGGMLLEGVRVVEFGMAAVGPEASLVLSELGADVIKIESSAHLDVLRLAGFDRVNCAFAFNVECRGRRSVTLNLDTERGRELAFQLCSRADVVVENYRGGVLDAMGLGYEAVKASNPGVVYASSQGYGRTGPLAGMAAYGPLNLGFVGLHHLWNHPDAPYPCGTSLNHPDHIAGKFLAAGVIAALDHRSRTGEGQRVDLAQTEFAAYLRGEVYIDAWSLGADPAPQGNASRTACPHGVYPTGGDDQWIAIVIPDDKSWLALCEAAGWPVDDDLMTLEGRLAHSAEISARLAEWTAEQDGPALAGFLQMQGISASPVMGPLDHLADEHLAARGFIVELEHPEVGSERHAGNPLRMSVTPQRIAPSAPCLGAHTTEVLGEVLGVAPAEVERLVAEGVCV